MKASELAKKLLDEVAAFGDRDVVIMCDHTDNEPLDIGDLGWLGDQNGERKIMIECYECREDGLSEKHMFDGEPEEASYPDDDDRVYGGDED